MGLTALGVGSGMDIGGIVSALVNAEKAPKEAQFNVDEGKLNTQISAIGSLKSAMSEFLDKLKPLSDIKTFTGFKSKLSNKDFLTATVNPEAVAGSYKLVVEQLAESQKQGSTAVADVTAPIGSGSLNFAVDGKSFDLAVAATDSLQDIMKNINAAEDNVGVTATIINGDAGAQLVLTSNKTGTANTVQVTATDDAGTALNDTFAMTELQSAKDAIIYVDGLKVTSDSNDIENAITGVSLTLTDADVAKSTTLTVEPNRETSKTAIKDFVTSYNEMMKTMSGMSGYDPNTKKAGVLQGDSLIRSIQSQLRGVMSASGDNGSGEIMLASMGIKTTREGLLEIDDTKLTEVLKTNANAVADFFTTEDTGFAAKVKGVADTYTQSGGILDSRDESLDKQLSRIKDSRESLALKMSAYESRLLKQYNAMDLLVGQLNTQSSMLAQRLDSLPGLVNKN
ncbi:flagellar filament capping protein FliD [Shewanella salipaludis]|uniref:Flagellar hook-associated protein 2 n=1 Tax=Shewanella salipaludis TaxID=2723052 RepID=A0A972G1N5_9GAMM|nr:flagellar filament capping protein FliD [Shewanella salipaludis]NMH65549.1 flagellar filament capping protein FliD [Shewanella salipaludis]